MQQPVASTQELAPELVFREHQIALLQVEASMLAAELLRSGFLEYEGYNSPTDWLRFNCHRLANGVLDPVGGAAVRTVLEPLARNLLGSPRRGCAGEPTTVCCPSATPTPWSSWPRPAGRPTSRSRPPSRP